MTDSSQNPIKKNSFDSLSAGQKLFYTLSLLQEHLVESSPRNISKLFSNRASLDDLKLISDLQRFIIETALDKLISRDVEAVFEAITQQNVLYSLSVNNVPSFLNDLSNVLDGSIDQKALMYSDGNESSFSLKEIKSIDKFAKNIRQFCKKASRAVSSFPIEGEEKKALHRKLVNYTLRVSTPATFAAALKATKKTAKGCDPDARREEVVSQLCAVLKGEEYSDKEKSAFLRILSKNTWTYNSLPKQLKAEDWARLLQAAGNEGGDLCGQVSVALDSRLSWWASFFGAAKVEIFRGDVNAFLTEQDRGLLLSRSITTESDSSDSDNDDSIREEVSSTSALVALALNIEMFNDSSDDSLVDFIDESDGEQEESDHDGDQLLDNSLMELSDSDSEGDSEDPLAAFSC